MTLGEKISKLRKKCGYTQEQLAQILGVSRQAVSRWESNLAYPETEKLIRLGNLFDCSMDYLLKEGQTEPEQFQFRPGLRDLYFERRSKKMIGGLPLWHINIGFGRTAKGVFAMGLAAKGVVSVGVFSLGLISLGAAAVGILSFGALALGLLSAGAIAAGIVALGAIAVGIVAIGALAVGDFAVGALAIGKFAAYGDAARAAVAIGKTEAVGSVYQSHRLDMQTVKAFLEETVPEWLRWAAWVFRLFLK